MLSIDGKLLSITDEMFLDDIILLLQNKLYLQNFLSVHRKSEPF